jgi:hypothetical protein
MHPGDGGQKLIVKKRVSTHVKKELTKTGLSVCGRHVHVMLLAVGVDAKSLKVNVTAGTKLRLDRAGHVDGRLHAQLGDAILHNLRNLSVGIPTICLFQAARTLKLMVMTPAISMAPQKEISPSPSARH